VIFEQMSCFAERKPGKSSLSDFDLLFRMLLPVLRVRRERFPFCSGFQREKSSCANNKIDLMRGRKKRAIKQLCAEKFFSSRGKVQLQLVQRKRWNGKLSFQEKSIATAALSNGGKLKLRFHSTKFLFATKSAVNFLGI
jgi:hypothetical protein